MALGAAGSGLVGAYDDLYGVAQVKGFRGHLRALRAGTVTSGLIKIVGVGARRPAAAVIIGAITTRPAGWPTSCIDTALIAGTANLVNLLDLRPGRAAKVIMLLGLPLVGHGGGRRRRRGGRQPAERSGRRGRCSATAVPTRWAPAWRPSPPTRCPGRPGCSRWPRIAGLNLASERVSFTAVIEKTPWLRRLDQLGRA